MSIQYKNFKLLDPKTESELNKWLEKNGGMIEMRSDNKGPNIQIVGTTDPVICIQFNPEKNTIPYYKQALGEEIEIRKRAIFGSIQQLEAHRAKMARVPHYEPQKGKHSPIETKMYIEHKNGVEMTKRDLLLQKAELGSLRKILKNLDDAVNGVFTDEENSMTDDEKADAANPA